LSDLRFFSLQKKLLILVLSSSLISILITTILFLNFDDISFLELEENIIGISIALMIGISAITITLSKRLSEPITKLDDAADKIANGDFDIRTNIKSNDEIGQLSISFDSMATKLQESLIAIKLREEIIKQQEDILVHFSHKNENCCVCIIDIIQSTVLTADLSNEQIQKFYGIFLNSVASIVKKFDGIVVKNVGDSLLFYFPNIESGDKSAFMNVIDCCLTICESNNEINMNMIQEKLPKMDFRISITYGTVNTAKIATSSVDDIFGAIVNVCSKINRFALPNNVVIGSHVYENIQSLDNYNLSNMNVNPISSDLNYSVYLVTRK